VRAGKNYLSICY